jgi:hypothetical protein
MDITSMLNQLQERESKCLENEKKIKIYDSAIAKIQEGLNEIHSLNMGTRIATSTGLPDKRCSRKEIKEKSFKDVVDSGSSDGESVDSEMSDKSVKKKPSWTENPEKQDIIRVKNRYIRGNKGKYKCPDTPVIDGGYQETDELRPEHNGHLYVWEYRMGRWVFRYDSEISPVYKTDICREWENGSCKNNKCECAFAHGEEDIRAKKQFINLIDIYPDDYPNHLPWKSR